MWTSGCSWCKIAFEFFFIFFQFSPSPCRSKFSCAKVESILNSWEYKANIFFLFFSAKCRNFHRRLSFSRSNCPVKKKKGSSLFMLLLQLFFFLFVFFHLTWSQTQNVFFFPFSFHTSVVYGTSRCKRGSKVSYFPDIQMSLLIQRLQTKNLGNVINQTRGELLRRRCAAADVTIWPKQNPQSANRRYRAPALSCNNKATLWGLPWYILPPQLQNKLL